MKNKKNVRIVRISAISKTEIVKNHSTVNTRLERVTVPSPEMIRKREVAGLSNRTKELAKIGKDVTPEAQKLFDKLSKTFELNWNGKVIECKQLELSISPPYGVDNCKGTDPTSVQRIKQVLLTINNTK